VNIERGIILSAIIIVAGAMFSENVWNALAALGTLGAVGAALYIGPYRDYRKRPILEFDFYEKKPPHLRQVMPNKDGVGPKGTLYPISIKITNNGRATARNAQVIISSVWTFDNDQWTAQSNWIPIPVKWALDEGNPRPTEEKDLVPYRPYVFNLGVMTSLNPTLLGLRTLISPRNQPILYGPGRYCFEVMVCTEGIREPYKRNFYVTWSGGCTSKLSETEKTIIVEMKEKPPVK
jgi:hypothetical protein